MNKNQIEIYQRVYSKGTRVELISMEDAHAVPSGTLGTVVAVDSLGTIHVKWDNGSMLGVCPDVDQICRAPMPKKETPPQDRGTAR